MLRTLFLVSLILTLIYGCASSSNSKPANNRSNESTSHAQKRPSDNTGSGYTKKIEQTKVITAASYKSTPQPVPGRTDTSASRQAVLELLAESKQAIDLNDYDEAENILKRALRIEPSNAWLWYNLAVVSFYQENYQQAIQQALKSNNLQHHAKNLRNNNYKLIEQSYIQLGETDKARRVKKK